MIAKKYMETLFYKIGSTGAAGLLMKRYRGKAAMLCYHRVVPAEEVSRAFDPVHLNSVSAGRFEEQIRYLADNYRLISIDEVAASLGAGSPGGCAAVTIDDGYKDTIECALPLLEKYNVPAVVYLNTCSPDEGEEVAAHEIVDIINSTDEISFDLSGSSYSWQLKNENDKMRCFSDLTGMVSSSSAKRAEVMPLLRAGAGSQSGEGLKYALTWDEIRRLDAHPLITIGAHTHNHLSLAGLPAEEAEYEMTHSRKRLEEELGHPVEHFAYPYGGPGQAGEREFGIARKSGFKTAVTVRNAGVQSEHAEHLHALPRYAVSERDTIPRLKAKLSGFEAFARHRGRVVVI